MAVGSWSSSGVVYPIADFWRFDYQIFASTNKSGSRCPEVINDMANRLTDQLKVNNSAVKIALGASPDINDGDFAFFFADIFVTSVQYGNRTGLCNFLSQIEDMPFDDQLLEVAKQAQIAGVAPGDYDRNVLKNVKITDSPARSWTYQYCTEFGWFQTP